MFEHPFKVSSLKVNWAYTCQENILNLRKNKNFKIPKNRCHHLKLKTRANKNFRNPNIDVAYIYKDPNNSETR